MGWFGKKKEEQKCCCAPETRARAEAAEAAAGVKVLGSGCAKCRALEEAARAALEELQMDPVIDHVTDFSQMAAYGYDHPGPCGRRQSGVLRKGLEKRGGQSADPERP